LNTLPPPAWLQTFDEAARHLSFTAAAQALNLSQAAVSKQIKLLEMHLGEPLFHRLPRSLKLTRAGEAYVPKVRDAFERLTTGTGEVFGRRRGDALTVRAAIGFAANWLAPRLPEFLALHPDIRLRITSSIWNEAEASAFDLDIQYGDGNWPGLMSERLTQEHLMPVCAPSLIASEKPLREPSDLSAHRLIHVLGYRDGWAQWLKAAGLPPQTGKPDLQFDTSLMALEMAALGQGVALGRTSMSTAMLASGRLVAPFDLQVPSNECFHLITSASAAKMPEAQAFRQWLLKVTASPYT
jgi:LysR family transcriptional regulator, glycine cleavage system transcriptional activator